MTKVCKEFLSWCDSVGAWYEDSPLALPCFGAGYVDDMNSLLIENPTLPPREKKSFYGDRYSYPVFGFEFNALKGDVFLWTVNVVMYDYGSSGWVLSGLRDGPCPCDYPYIEPDYWSYTADLNVHHISVSTTFLKNRDKLEFLRW